MPDGVRIGVAIAQPGEPGAVGAIQEGELAKLVEREPPGPQLLGTVEQSLEPLELELRVTRNPTRVCGIAH
jgi:hypothetical protein